jgi:hypothetical protein
MARYAFNSSRRVRRAPIPMTLSSQVELARRNSIGDAVIKEVRHMLNGEFHTYSEGRTTKGVVVARFQYGEQL